MREKLFEITKKDFKITYFSGSGAGGQHRNRHKNCVRIYHPDSGIIATGQSHKSQKANKREAFRNLVNNPKFKIYLNKRAWECIHQMKSIEREVEKEMAESNLKVEVVGKDGNWVPTEEIA